MGDADITVAYSYARKVRILDKTICFRVDEDFFKEVKLRTIEKGMTLQAYMQDLIQKDLNPVTEEDLIHRAEEMERLLEEMRQHIESAKEAETAGSCRDADESELDNEPEGIMRMY